MQPMELGANTALLVGESAEGSLERSLLTVLAAWRANGRRTVFGSIHDPAVAGVLAAAGVRNVLILGGEGDDAGRAVARAIELGYRARWICAGRAGRDAVSAEAVLDALARAAGPRRVAWPPSLEPI